MNEYLSGYPLRLAIGAVITLVLISFWVCSASKPSIVIHWGMVEDCDGCDVIIDGEVAGQLKLFGQNPTTGFEVEEGTHSIEIKHPTFESEPKTIVTDSPGQKVDLWLEIAERYNEKSGFETVIVFQ